MDGCCTPSASRSGGNLAGKGVKSSWLLHLEGKGEKHIFLRHLEHVLSAAAKWASLAPSPPSPGQNWEASSGVITVLSFLEAGQQDSTCWIRDQHIQHILFLLKLLKEFLSSLFTNSDWILKKKNVFLDPFGTKVSPVNKILFAFKIGHTCAIRMDIVCTISCIGYHLINESLLL